MSTYHASLDSCEHLEAASERSPWSAIASLRAAASALVASLLAQVHARRMQRRLARYPDHLLRDVGFGRDWDGTIAPLRNEPDASA